MRLRTIVPLVLFSASVVGQDYWCLNHSFRVYADYGYIRRQDVRNLSLVNLEENKQSSKTVIDNEDLEERLGWESAIRGGIVYNATACNSWEATYTYFYPWKASKTATGDGKLFFPF